MFCPDCGTPTGVVHSQPEKDHRLRRRECRACGARFTTTETVLTGTIARVGPLPLAPRAHIVRELRTPRHYSEQLANWARACLRLGPQGFPGRVGSEAPAAPNELAAEMAETAEPSFAASAP